ncbi:hypothetical protein IM697_02795 [Streptomyces ferrugineus]|uniref:Lipoprotein n=1 Tax=Streptomyces ferrugineus TaxID=1413221 RepID=A0A7M2SM99_9ACTN|nr:hypothetical protein [Streptomyces ferrugineus]QOV37384.1 hypothetical protein IM697_02795 [Streptomyces ferrugineus]
MTERQQHRRMRGAGVAAGVLCACLAGSGCAEQGAAAEDAHGEGAVQVVRRAADALVEARSSKAHTSMEMATGGTRVTIRGEGVYNFRKQLGRLKVLLPQDPAGATAQRPIMELLAPGALYMKNRGAGVPEDKWVRVDTQTLSDGNLVTGGATDPFAAAEVLRGARKAAYVGEEKVAGTAVRHYRGTADLGIAAEEASRGNAQALAAAAKGFATDQVPFDVFLDEDGRIRKVRHRFSFVNGQQDGAVAVASTTVLYDFGAPADVRLPDSDDIYAGKIAED